MGQGGEGRDGIVRNVGEGTELVLVEQPSLFQQGDAGRREPRTSRARLAVGPNLLQQLFLGKDALAVLNQE